MNGGQPVRSPFRLLRGQTLPLVLATLLAVGPMSGLVRLVASAVVAQNPAPTNEEESDSKEDKAKRLARPHGRPVPIPTAIRPVARIPAGDGRPQPFPPARHLTSAHGLDGPHLRC